MNHSRALVAISLLGTILCQAAPAQTEQPAGATTSVDAAQALAKRTGRPILAMAGTAT